MSRLGQSDGVGSLKHFSWKFLCCAHVVECQCVFNAWYVPSVSAQVVVVTTDMDLGFALA